MTPNYVRAEHRWRGIGGRDIAAILGMTPNHRAAIDVYDDQVAIDEALQSGEVDPVPPSHLAEEEVGPRSPLWWGIRHEPAVIEAWGIEHPEFVAFRAPLPSVRHETDWWWRASVDGLAWMASRLADWQACVASARDMPDLPIIATRLVPPDVLLEAKTHVGVMRGQYGDEGTDEVPDDKRCQGYWYGGLLHVDVVEYPVLFDTSQPGWFRVGVDRAAVDDMRQVAHDFVRDHVMRRVPPPPDGSARFSEHLSRRFAERDDVEVVASTELAEQVAELKRIKAEIKRLEAEETRVGQVVRVGIGAATSLVDARGRKLATWRRNSAGAPAYKDAIEALAAAHGIAPRLVEAVVDQNRGTPPRVLRLSK